jgi:hypothetical protein
MTTDEMVNALVAKYESTKRTDGYEPNWTLHPFDIFYAYKNGGVNAVRKELGFHPEDYTDEEVMQELHDIAKGMMIEDGAVHSDGLFPDRVMHDGYKIGTTSWIFMNRHKSKLITCQFMSKELAIVSRDIPVELRSKLRGPHPECGHTLYTAYYYKGDGYGCEIGPVFSLDHIYQICQEYGA